MRTIQISPSVYAAGLDGLRETLEILQKAGADLLHIDIMDGRFVERMAFGADHVRMLKCMTALPLDVHLMVQEPERHLDLMAAAGADIITVHAESTTRLYSCLQKIRSRGLRAGVAISPGTSEQVLLPVLDVMDMALFMTVNPGEGGQHYLPEVADKIRRFRLLAGNRPPLIEVDGSIDAATIVPCVRAGANVFVSGGYLFQGDITANLRTLRAAAEAAEFA